MAGCGTVGFHKAAERNLQAGVAAYEIGDYARALYYLEPLAEQGDSVAQTKLGNMYYLGLGVPEDNGKAAEWFRKASARGDLEAQMMLATLYMMGAGVSQNTEEAAKLLRDPAEWGIGGAQFLLGILYMNGEGVPRDLVRAYMWMELADQRGSRAAGEALRLMAAEMSARQIARAEGMAATWKPRRGRGDH